MAIGDSRPQIVVLPPQGINSQPAMDPSDSRPQYVVIQNGTQPTMVPMNPEMKKMEKARIEKLFPKKTRSILSILQLVFAGLAGLMQIILFCYDRWGIALTGMGIWSGFFFGIAGGVGLIAAHRPSRRSLKAFMVMSIIGTIFAVILIVISWVGIHQSSHRGFYRNPGQTVVFCILLLTALAEGVVSVIAASYVCRVLPCCCAEPTSFYETRMTSGHVAVPMTSTIAPSNGQGMPPQYSNVVGANGYASAPAVQEKTPY